MIPEMDLQARLGAVGANALPITPPRRRDTTRRALHRRTGGGSSVRESFSLISDDRLIYTLAGPKLLTNPLFQPTNLRDRARSARVRCRGYVVSHRTRRPHVLTPCGRNAVGLPGRRRAPGTIPSTSAILPTTLPIVSRTSVRPWPGLPLSRRNIAGQECGRCARLSRR